MRDRHGSGVCLGGIIKALNSPDPPARKKIHREPAALNGLHGRIDAMIEADPAIGTTAI